MQPVLRFTILASIATAVGLVLASCSETRLAADHRGDPTEDTSDDALALKRAAAASGANLRLAIAAPLTRQVIQRLDNNFGRIAVIGTFLGDRPETIQVRTTVGSGFIGGAAVDWRALEGLAIGTLPGQPRTFVGYLTQPAGGWYTLQVRAVAGGRVGPVASVDHIGVGEVFITAGQSNSTDYGIRKRHTAVDDHVSAFSGHGWQKAADTMPVVPVSDGGTGSGPWDVTGNALVARLRVPVAFVVVGWGGTAIFMWQPGYLWTQRHVVLFDRIKYALNQLEGQGGARAILWHQGEADSTAQNWPDYQAKLTTLIQSSFAQTALPVKFVVAQVATGGHDAYLLRPGEDACGHRDPETNRRAQCNVVDNVRIFRGPTTDDLGLAFRAGPTNPHFNDAGLDEHGKRWAGILADSPGLISTPH